MRITWEQTGDEFPTRWDSSCVRRNDNGPMWFGRITTASEAYLLEVWKNAGQTCHWERCPTLAEAKRRGAEVLRALCGGPVPKSATVWCGVDPQGRVMPTAIGKTRESAWWALVWELSAEVQTPRQAKAASFTVRRFRLEEVCPHHHRNEGAK